MVDKFVAELEGQLDDRQVEILLTDAARAWLVEKGYSTEYGARPLARTIQEHIKKPLAEELIRPPRQGRDGGGGYGRGPA